MIPIIVDTREQTPFKFKGAIVQTLKTGDYSISEMEDLITIERKTPQELFTIAGKDRKRFVRELERMTAFDFAAIVIQGDMKDLTTPSQFSRVSPKVVINSLVSWMIKYRIPFIPAGNRELARALTYRLLEKYWKYKTVGIRNEK
jgi:DNA excision repair protein ERCC-4